MESLHPVLDLLSAYPYIALFAGMLIAGEVVLLPAIFLAATGRIDLAAVVLVALLATLISDAFWYGLGRRFPSALLKRVSGRIGKNSLSNLEQTFSAGGGRILFMSKFVYGTRTLVQVLAGVHGMPLRSYLPINMAAVLAVIVLLILISRLVIGTAYQLDEVLQHLEVAFLLFVVITVAGLFLFSRRMKKRWSV